MDGNVFFLILVFVGLFSAILSGMPAMFAIGGAPLLVAGLGIFTGHFDPSFLHAFPQRVLGVMGNQLFVALPLFIFMGVILEKAGLASLMLGEVNRLVGNSKRSVGLSVLGISTLIAATTGIVGATIVMLGTISYPALVRSGYSEKLACGLVVSAGTLGQIIPPSIVLIILADQISIAYQQAQRAGGNFSVEPVTVSNMFAGALLPGLLLAFLFAMYLMFADGNGKATTNTNTNTNTGENCSQVQGSSRLRQNHSGQIDKSGQSIILLMPVFLILAVLGSIVFGIATPTEAASLGAIGSLLLGGMNVSSDVPFCYHAIRLGLISMLLLAFARFLPDSAGLICAFIFTIGLAVGIIFASICLWQSAVLPTVLSEVTYLSGMIFGIVVAASMLSLVFRGFEGDVLFAEMAQALPGEKWGALIAVMLIVFFLGFVLEFIEIIFIVVPIAGPVLLAMDIHPVWLGVLFALNLQTSFLTPPFGVALFYFRSVAPKSLETKTLYRAIIPFVMLQLLALVLVAIFPEIALILPELLF